MAAEGTPDRNGGVERAAEALVVALFAIFCVIGTLLRVVWLAALAFYRTLEQFQAAGNPSTYLLITICRSNSPF
jgi:hypothetical protein